MVAVVVVVGMDSLRADKGQPPKGSVSSSSSSSESESSRSVGMEEGLHGGKEECVRIGVFIHTYIRVHAHDRVTNIERDRRARSADREHAVLFFLDFFLKGKKESYEKVDMGRV